MQIFDSSLKKKKKKKKTTFDIDAALAEGKVPDTDVGEVLVTDKENQEPARVDNDSKKMEIDGKNSAVHCRKLHCSRPCGGKYLLYALCSL